MRLMHYFAVVRRQRNPVRFILSRLLCALSVNEWFTIQRSNYKLIFFNTGISRNLWVANDSRQEDEIFLQDYLKPNDYMVDVGANVGTLTLRAAGILRDNTLQPSILSIEANAYIYHCLTRNVALNHAEAIVSTKHLAVGDREQMVSLSSEKNDGLKHVVLEDASESIPMKRLDQLLQNQVVHLLKVDVEGFELNVFRGASTLLPHVVGIYFEFDKRHTEQFGYGLSEILDFLNPFGFSFFEPDMKKKTLRKVTTDFSAKGTRNILAIREKDLLQRLPTYTIH